MSIRQEKRVPKYRKHRQSGQAIVTLTGGGRRRDVLLGKYGTRESREQYARTVAQWEANDRRLPRPVAADLTVSELVAAFWPHVEKHYRRPDGTQTSEVIEFRQSLRPLAHLYGSTSVNGFTPGALKAVRQLG